MVVWWWFGGGLMVVWWWFGHPPAPTPADIYQNLAFANSGHSRFNGFVFNLSAEYAAVENISEVISKLQNLNLEQQQLVANLITKISATSPNNTESNKFLS
mgnify:CR=1 FL=1